MESLSIGVFWTEGQKGDPLVGVKIFRYQGTGELQKVIGAIEGGLRSSFPGERVMILNSAKKVLDGGVGEEP